ncbi:hypothetical protein ACUN29_20635 [Streptomyces sp. WC2508]|uniref:hypothetical protein n=1 Tax=Streptomyces sp. WC2508 TaxID=3461405 RepID=UPI0040447C48
MDYLISVVERLDGSPTPRDLKYAVLHLQAATEVLLKARLIAHDWKLLFSTPTEADQGAFNRGDFQSCTLDDTIKRLRKHAAVPVPPEAKGNITHLAKQRNRLQHFGLTEPAAAIESRTALVLDFLLDFVHDQLRPKLSGPDLSHLDEQMEVVRCGLSQVQALVKARMDRIQPALDEVAQWTVQCGTCGQWAVVADGHKPTCRFCGVSWDCERAAEEYAADFLGLTRYEAVTGFSGDPTLCCPNCDMDALVHDVHIAAQREQPVHFCFTCGEKFAALDYCSSCSNPMVPNDGGLVICDTCFSHELDRN